MPDPENPASLNAKKSKHESRPEAALVFDYGERSIGVANATTAAGFVNEVDTLAASAGQPDWHAVKTLIDEWEPRVLVVGLPYNEDGSEGPMTKRAREFAAELRARYQLPTEMVDERLTSAEAESILRAQRRAGLKKRRTRKQDIDSMAARLIGESWLRGAGEKESDNNEH